MKKRMISIAVAAVLVSVGGVFGQDPLPPHEQHYTGEQIAAFLQSQAPEVWRELEEIKLREPGVYQQLLNDRRFMMMRYNELKMSDQQQADAFLRVERMEATTKELARTLRQTSDPNARTDIKRKLKTMVEEVFDLRLAERETEVKHLERELTKIQSMLQTRRQARDQIIDRRVRELADERDEATAWW